MGEFESQGILALLIPVVAIVAWAIYAIVSVVMRSRVHELKVRERIAMIEKGLVPPPERDPGAFERAMAPMSPDVSSPPPVSYGHYRAYKHRSAGITMMAVGFGLMVMMYPNFRVGGFLVVVGIGFIISGLMERPAGPNQL
jgi:hypothetical protein